MPKSLEQILGGYATDTLTEEENRQLMEAALHDQTLFDALADEEALKALLADSKTRQRILLSLEESQKSLWVAPSQPSWFSWFRQPSSLTWAGSIAALGLALIFGWQMEKDWGPFVEQDELAERSQAKNQETKEVASRPQATQEASIQEKREDRQKNRETESERVVDTSSPVPSPSSLSNTKVAKKSSSERQPSAQVLSEDFRQDEVKQDRQSKIQDSTSQIPATAIVQDVPNSKPRLAQSATSPASAEQDLKDLSQTSSSTAKREGGDIASSSQTRESVKANKRARVEVVEGKLDSGRKQQTLGEKIPKTSTALSGEMADVQHIQDIVQAYSQRQTKGIRYRFIQPVVDGKDKAIDVKKFSGKWSNLHLIVESNVAGYLYVLTTFGKGKFQWMRPRSPKVKLSSDGAIMMKGFRSVDFALSQVTNALGKPVVSSITVLLSSTPIADLGQWLGGGPNLYPSEGNLTKYRSRDHFVINPGLASEVPLRATITLETGKRSREVLESLPPSEFFP